LRAARPPHILGRMANLRSVIVYAAAAIVLATTVMSCGGDPGGSNSATCGGGFGTGSPPCSCISWTYEVTPWTGCCCSDCVPVQPDTSRSPARVTLRVGQKIMVASHIDQAQPDRCNQGWDTRPTWNVVASVLRLESSQPASVTTAVFVATAPGVTTITADLRTPSGRFEPVGLSYCVEERVTGFTIECVRRVPLEVAVEP